MNKVCIMMSTYNGEKYLKEQMESILLQQNIKPYILIRDDGSSDKTISLLKSYATLYPDNIALILGKNIGWKNSFIELMYEAVKYRDAEYFAFADQDDVWVADKMMSGVNAIGRDKKKAAIYYADLMVIDENGKQLYKYGHRMLEEDKEKKRILLEGSIVSPGCTLFFNRKLLEIATYGKKEMLLNANIPHDHWIGMVAVYFAKIVCSNEICILHRRHDKSVSNSGQKRKRKFWPKYISCASVFADTYIDSGLLDKRDRRYLLMIQNYKTNYIFKMKLLTDSDLRYDSILGSIKLKIAIILSNF